MNLRRLGWTAAAAMAAASLRAHPGHAPFSEGAQHFLTSPVHLLPALLFSLGLCAAAQFLNRRGERLFIRGVAALIALVAILG